MGTIINEINNNKPGSHRMSCLKIFAIAFMVLLASGCGKPKEPQQKPQPSKAIEDMSGITTIKQGEQMKRKLKEFEKTQKERSKEMENVE